MARRTPDRRTVLVSAGIALVAAILAGGAAFALLSDDDSSNQPAGTLELTDDAAVDGRAMAAVELELADGTTTTLPELAAAEGRRTLVNLWQSSCAPCIDEMPMLEEAAQDTPGVAFVGVAPLDQADDAARLAERTAITYPWALDPRGDLFAESHAAGLPTTLLLAADGTVLVTKTGAFSSRAELDEFLAVGG